MPTTGTRRGPALVVRLRHHRCFGAGLAELHLATLIEEMARRDMEVAITGQAERLPSCFTNGFHRLPVILSRGNG